jgi:outer membrane protein assembly factor BamE (lipoprotein component of BamABCDE complex)
MFLWGYSKMRRGLQLSLSLTVALLLSTACAPVVSQRGYIPDQEKLASIQVGVDDKATVEDRLGTPTNIATFDGDVWYYISSVEEQFAFFDPETTERNILAISFDAEGKVSNLEKYTLEDGQVVAIVDRETPTRGRELSFLQQMFGNIGRGIGGQGGGQGGEK